MSTEMMRTATGSYRPAARALGATATCWYALPAAASAHAVRPKHAAVKQAIRVNVTDFGPRPPLRSSP